MLSLCGPLGALLSPPLALQPGFAPLSSNCNLFLPAKMPPTFLEVASSLPLVVQFFYQYQSPGQFLERSECNGSYLAVLEG